MGVKFSCIVPTSPAEGPGFDPEQNNLWGPLQLASIPAGQIHTWGSLATIAMGVKLRLVQSLCPPLLSFSHSQLRKPVVTTEH